MKKILLVGIIIGIILSACQKADVLITESQSDSALNDEKGTFKLVSDVIVNKDDINNFSALRSTVAHGYEQSVPIYRYYRYERAYSDHYYGTEYNPKGLVLNGKKYSLEPWWGFNIERNDNNVYDKKLRQLFRYYAPSINDHALTIAFGMSGGYKFETCLGRVFTTPRLGTVPLWELYSPVDKDHVYMWANRELLRFENNPGTYFKKGIVGYVYPGKRIDQNKTANFFNVSRLSTKPACNITMKVNVREGDTYRILTYTYYWGKGPSEATFSLPNTYVVVSIDMTIGTDFNVHTKTFHLDATEMSYSGILNGKKIGVNLHINKDTYHKTSIELLY